MYFVLTVFGLDDRPTAAGSGSGSPFFTPPTPAEAATAATGGQSPKTMLGQGLGWLQAAGQKAEAAGASRGSTSAKVFGQGLSWISRELAPEAPPSMADALRPLFFPPAPQAAPKPAAAAVAAPKPAGSSAADAAPRRPPARSEQKPPFLFCCERV